MLRRISVLVLLAGFVAAGSYAARNAQLIAALAESESSEQLAESNRGIEATRAIVRSRVRGNEAASQWASAEMSAALEQGNLARLFAFSDATIENNLSNERLALFACRALLLQERVRLIGRIREAWRQREGDATAWQALDAELLLRLGKQVDAQKLLSQTPLPHDAQRLTLLARTSGEPATAMKYLEQARGMAPHDVDIALLEADHCSRWGAGPEASARVANLLRQYPGDWEVRDRCAAIACQAGDIALAQTAWLPTDTVAPPDFAWVKAFFWNRVANKIDYDWLGNAPDRGPLEALVELLVELPEGCFWQGRIAETQARPNVLSIQRQEVYWLTLLALLQHGRETTALNLVQTRPFGTASWQPDLECALEQMLAYRLGLTQRTPATTWPRVSHPFVAELLQPNINALWPQTERLIRSREAFSAVLFAVGWDEAALAFHLQASDLSDLPAWYGERLLQSLAQRRGADAALQLALAQPRNAKADLLTGTLLCRVGQIEAGLQRLLSACDDPVTAVVATERYVSVALKCRKVGAAERCLRKCPSLADSSAGRILLARCAALAGRDDEAERFYRELSPKHPEASAYLARRQLAGGDWAAALDQLARPR